MHPLGRDAVYRDGVPTPTQSHRHQREAPSRQGVNREWPIPLWAWGSLWVQRRVVRSAGFQPARPAIRMQARCLRSGFATTVRCTAMISRPPCVQHHPARTQEYGRRKTEASSVGETRRWQATVVRSSARPLATEKGPPDGRLVHGYAW